MGDTRNFKIEDIEEAQWCRGDGGITIVEDIYERMSRWSVWFQRIVRVDDDGSHWMVAWPVPATELQESELYGEDIEGFRVFPVEGAVTVWRAGAKNVTEVT